MDSKYLGYHMIASLESIDSSSDKAFEHTQTHTNDNYFGWFMYCVWMCMRKIALKNHIIYMSLSIMTVTTQS